MSDEAAPERPGLLRRALLHWTAVTTTVFWLPLVRSLFDGASYRWQFFAFSGQGAGGDLWFPLVGAAGAAATLYLGWRGGRFPFHLLLVGWHGFLAAGLVWLALTEPEPLTFEGATLGTSVRLDVIGPALFGAVALAAIWWVVRDLLRERSAVAPPWNRRELRVLAIFGAALPAQALLLRLGPPDGLTDQVGVVVTLFQWCLIGLALKPRTEPG